MKGPGRHHADVGRHLGCLGRRSGRGKSYACSAQNSIGPTQLTWPGTADLGCRQTRPPGRPDVAAPQQPDPEVSDPRVSGAGEIGGLVRTTPPKPSVLSEAIKALRWPCALTHPLTNPLTHCPPSRSALTVRPHCSPSPPAPPVRRCLRRGRARRGAVQSADLPGRSAPTGPSSDARARPANAAESVGSAPE